MKAITAKFDRMHTARQRRLSRLRRRFKNYSRISLLDLQRSFGLALDRTFDTLNPLMKPGKAFRIRNLRCNWWAVTDELDRRQREEMAKQI